MDSNANDQVNVVFSPTYMPNFYDFSPSIWFGILESHFMGARITADITKYNQFINYLLREALLVAQNVLVDTNIDGKYTRLRDAVLAWATPSNKEKIQKLCHTMQLGDKKPSELLRDMRTLAGADVQESWLQEIWLERLPSDVQAILVASLPSPLAQLATVADTVMERLKPVTVGMQNAFSILPSPASTSHKPGSETPSDLGQLILAALQEIKANSHKDAIQRLERQVAELKLENTDLRRRFRTSSTSPRRPIRRSVSRTRGSLCWYHERYGNRARRCEPKCPQYASFQGN